MLLFKNKFKKQLVYEYLNALYSSERGLVGLVKKLWNESEANEYDILIFLFNVGLTLSYVTLQMPHVNVMSLMLQNGITP